MDPEKEFTIGTLKVLLDFIGQHIWALILVIFILTFRKPISGLIERIIKLNIGWGDASGGVEASIPSHMPNDGLRPEIESTVSPPSDEASEPVELKEKEEEAKDWFLKMRKAFHDGNTAKATQVFEEHQRDEEGSDQRHSNEALFLYFLYIDGNETTALTRIEELHARSANDKQLHDSVIWLSLCYDAAKNYDKEMKLWKEAISKVDDEGKKTSFVAYLANAYKKNGDVNLGIELIEERLMEVVEHEQRAKLYKALSSLEKENGDSEAAALALEKVVELSPGDCEKLFDAAYEQSNEKLKLLSVSNYLTLLALKPRHSTALNNLGVCLSEFKLKGKQISLFRQSMGEGSTLAMANLAGRFIDGGFWKEAKEILDKARVMEEPHENVGNVSYRLSSIKSQEEEELSALTKKAEAFQRQVRLYGDAFFDRSAAYLDCSGAWYTTGGEEIRIEVDGQKISGEWIEISHAFALSLSYECSISGTRRNRAAAVTYKKHRGNKSSSTLLGSLQDEWINCYSYLSADKQTWEFFSNEPEKEFKLTLHRKAPRRELREQNT